MNLCKYLGVIVATGILAIASQLMAGQSYLDGSAKARGDYGQMEIRNNRNNGNYYNYRAQTTETAQQETTASGQTSSQANTQQQAPSSIAENNNTQTTRSYSYDPNTAASSTGTMGTTQRRSNSTQPLWALPKSDQRKFGGQ
jgi:hypothetical protein